MRRGLMVGIITVIIVFAGMLMVKNSSSGSGEIILSERQEQRLTKFLEQNPDAIKVEGRTYRIYYTKDSYVVVGNTLDAENEIKKLISNKN